MNHPDGENRVTKSAWAVATALTTAFILWSSSQFYLWAGDLAHKNELEAISKEIQGIDTAVQYMIAKGYIDDFEREKASSTNWTQVKEAELNFWINEKHRLSRLLMERATRGQQ